MIIFVQPPNSPYSYDHFANWSSADYPQWGDAACYYAGTRINHGWTEDTVQDTAEIIEIQYRNEFKGDLGRCCEPGNIVIAVEPGASSGISSIVARSTKRDLKVSMVLPVYDIWQVTNIEAVLTEMVNAAVAAGVGAPCP